MFTTKFNGTDFRKSDKIMSLCYVNFKSCRMGTFFFSDSLIIGTKNWDLSQILFGQKSPKGAIEPWPLG